MNEVPQPILPLCAQCEGKDSDRCTSCGAPTLFDRIVIGGAWCIACTMATIAIARLLRFY